MIRAVGYIRMSSDRQEASPGQQREEILKLAKKDGYEIIRWYVDEGISGDATEQRKDFQRMIKDAETLNDFCVIVCWDQDRFGRFDSIEAGRWIHPLRKTGVTLATVAQGKIDWNDFAGRMLYNIQQEGKHQFLRDLSRNTARGQIRNARNGYSCGQAAPYGYDRMLIDESGNHKQRVRNGEKFSKPQGWHVTFVPSDDPIKVDSVRWIFKTYAEQDIGYRALAAELNRRRIPSPNGGQWGDSTVRAILANEAYMGTFQWGKRREGKYHRVTGDNVLPRDPREVRLAANGKPNAIDNPEEAWIVVENAHEPLIDKKTFDAVQAKIVRRSRKSGGGYRTHTKKNDNAYLLSGLIYCEQCGARMHGWCSTRKKNGKAYKYRRYVCSSYTRSGKHNESGCRRYAISQDAVYDVIIKKLSETLFMGHNMDRLRQCIRGRLEVCCKPDASQTEKLRRRLRELDKQLDRFSKNWFETPESLLKQLTEEAEAKKRERETIADQLATLEAAADRIDIESTTEKIAEKSLALSEELQSAEPARIRELFRQLVERVEVNFTERHRGKRREYQPVGGRITFRTESLGFASRGDWI